MFPQTIAQSVDSSSNVPLAYKIGTHFWSPCDGKSSSACMKKIVNNKTMLRHLKNTKLTLIHCIIPLKGFFRLASSSLTLLDPRDGFFMRIIASARTKSSSHKVNVQVIISFSKLTSLKKVTIFEFHVEFTIIHNHFWFHRIPVFHKRFRCRFEFLEINTDLQSCNICLNGTIFSKNTWSFTKSPS